MKHTGDAGDSDKLFNVFLPYTQDVCWVSFQFVTVFGVCVLKDYPPFSQKACDTLYPLPMGIFKSSFQMVFEEKTHQFQTRLKHHKKKTYYPENGGFLAKLMGTYFRKG